MSMKLKKDNRDKIIRRSNLSSLCFLLCGVIFLLWIIYPDKASSGPYLDSAHGSTSYGVNRTSLSSFGYSIANCTHCHEEHASIGGSQPVPADGADKFTLFANNFNTTKSANPYVQSDSVCFYCHISTGTLQSPSFNNYSYSYTFGGCSLADCPTANIFDAFNGLSYHNLYDVWRLITGQSGTKTFPNFPNDSSPCSGCHNIHIAQRSCGKPTGSFDTTKAAISKPSDHGNLWGDGAGEKMSNYTGGYQAPYNSATPTYEPDGSAISDPSKLLDYVTFCTDCHNATNTIYSTTLSRNLYTFNWATGEMHGGFAATYCSKSGQSLLAMPYDGLTKCGQYVTACTDCHEPHGSLNNFFARKWVNNGMVTVTNNGTGNGPDGRANKEWAWLCGKCHTYLDSGDAINTHHGATGFGCTTCHPGGNYRNCTDCHFHGNSLIDGVPYGKPLF